MDTFCIDKRLPRKRKKEKKWL
ncbi:hypothetical protein R3I94_001691 [Phoxinus phoxinus]